MLLYALRRLIYLVPVAFGVSLLVFALVHLAPGDPISAIVPPDAPQEVVDKLKEYYGFDKPLPIQYLRWLGVTLTGDFGTSIGTGRPVATEVASAFGNTIILAISATLLAFSLAIILFVMRRGRFQAELKEDHILVTQPYHEEIPYSSIIAVQRDSNGKKDRRAIFVHHAEGVMKIPEKVGVKSSELLEFLKGFVPPGERDQLPVELQHIWMPSPPSSELSAFLPLPHAINR